MKKRLIFMCTILFWMVQMVHAQDRRVSGKVSAIDGQSVPGVSVQLKGTTRGVNTDNNGNFTIAVNSNSDVLVFTAVGYRSQEIIVGNQTIINATLVEESRALDEVVVTGYGSQRKKDITGAVTVVKGADLTALPTANLTQALQGRAAGVTVGTDNSPGGGTMVRIRGFGTINNNSPLYIVDGVPTQGTLNNINPNDIESLQVLKDASAASIYGARAANGVVIITTKKGKPRRAQAYL
ncbi:TonB-dependent SusC/RagA subfamily outer membrane receptor [Siphonobacter sp. SORGH_AS 1065]|nr:TonB-dependent SusC/RagA subfamily outer membrane receptor [Siphonobacter sp. SORGH_AS_1065]